MDEECIKFGQSVKAHRVSRGMNQSQLGVLLGCSQAMVSFYESGRCWPPLDVARIMAKELGIPIVDRGYDAQ